MIIKKYYKLLRVSHEDSEYLRIKNISNDVGIFKMVKVGNPISPNLEYSTDGITWTTYDFTTLPEVAVAAGANIYLRGTNSGNRFNRSNENYVKFSFSKTCEAHGNMCSLFNTSPSTFSSTTYLNEYAFYSCFSDFTTLTTAPSLGNVTSIYEGALGSTFRGCTSLISPLNISSVTSISSTGMNGTFMGCTSLTSAPSFANVTSVGISGVNSTFTGCTSLTSAPSFANVTSVGMYGFGGCFKDCVKISSVIAPNIQDLDTNTPLYNWLDGAGTDVPAGTTKTVRVPTGANIPSGANGIPNGWTRVDY